MSVSADPPAGR